MRRVVTMAVTAILALSFLACAPKVDCKKLKGKLDKCAEDILWELKQKSKENYDKHEDKTKVKKELDEAVATLRKSLEKKVYKPCKKHDGRAKDAKKVSKCLKKESCEEFAACIVQFIKK